MSENTGNQRRPMRGGMGHGPGHGMMGEKPKDFKGSIRKMLKVVKTYRIGLIFVIVFAVGSTIFDILGPKILSRATDEKGTGTGRD